MKKELLMASALVSTLGAASVAEAVTATTSGSLKLGQEFDSPDSGTDTNSNISNTNFSVSLSETTDGGTTISSSFMLTNESSGAPDDDNAIKLTFSDGSALELLNAGNASGTHAVSVPGAAGEQGVAGTTTANAPTGLAFGAASTALGVEWHSASDFLMDGLKVSASFSTDDGAANTATANVDSSWGIGATYVTTAGDSTVTIGGGVADSESGKTGTEITSERNGMHVGVSAVTGDLTVAVGFADGSKAGVSDNGSDEYTAEVVKAGVKYVTGDLTFNVGIASGDADDHALGGSDGADDAQDVTSASVSYAVAAGVTAILGYTSTDSSDEGLATDDGSAWYIGANMSF